MEVKQRLNSVDQKMNFVKGESINRVFNRPPQEIARALSRPSAPSLIKRTFVPPSSTMVKRFPMETHKSECSLSSSFNSA